MHASEQYYFPVGKVERIMPYPLDFEEFLWVNKEERLAQEISAAFSAMETLMETLYQKAIELYRA